MLQKSFSVQNRYAGKARRAGALAYEMLDTNHTNLLNPVSVLTRQTKDGFSNQYNSSASQVNTPNLRLPKMRTSIIIQHPHPSYHYLIASEIPRPLINTI